MVSTVLVLATLLLRLTWAAPTATIKDGVVVGTSLSNIDNFYGIPYAQPPVGNLRLRPPQPIQAPYGTISVTNPSPTACPQPQSPVIPNIGENCLNLNVIRPSNTGATKLPVIVFVFGGAFVDGSSSANINGTYFVQQSMKLGQPFIWVAMNYRLNGFGFLAGSQLTTEGSTNLGLRDQRAALQWVQNNIGAFGGDPSKVTLWGFSAGSIAAFDQTLVNSGNNTYNGQPLFRAGIFSSGSLLPALPTNSQRAQDIFEAVAAGVNCQTSNDKLTCLRNAPYQDLLNAVFAATNRIPNFQFFDFLYLPRPDPSSSFFQYSPEDAVVNDKYTKLPVIITDVEDEGTGFVEKANIQTVPDLITALNRHFPVSTTDDITKLVNAYPADLAQGSPFRTGNNYNIYPQYKRFAAIFGDVTFTMLRRGYIYLANNKMNVWTALSTAAYNSPFSSYKGTYHAADLALLQYVYAGQLVPRDSLLTYIVSFVSFSDPNKISSPYPVWNKFTSQSPQILNISFSAVTNMYEQFRDNQYQTIVSILGRLKL